LDTLFLGHSAHGTSSEFNLPADPNALVHEVIQNEIAVQARDRTCRRFRETTFARPSTGSLFSMGPIEICSLLLSKRKDIMASEV
jgi:hypothetical protein